MMFIQTHHAYGTVPTFRAKRRGEVVGARRGHPSGATPPPPPSCAATWTWPPRAWRGAAGPPRWSRALRLAAGAGVTARACRRPPRRSRLGSPTAAKWRNPTHSRVELFKYLHLFYILWALRGRSGRGFCLKVSSKKKAKVRAESREMEVCKPQIWNDSEDPGTASWLMLDKALQHSGPSCLKG